MIIVLSFLTALVLLVILVLMGIVLTVLLDDLEVITTQQAVDMFDTLLSIWWYAPAVVLFTASLALIFIEQL